MDNTSPMDNMTSSNISIRESSVMNVKDTEIRINKGIIIQKTSDLALTVNLIQKCPAFW